MPTQQTKQGEYFYHIPLTQKEVLSFSMTTDKTSPEFYSKFFKNILTSDRPRRINDDMTYITFSRSTLTPNKVNWKRFRQGDKPDLKTFHMVSKPLVDELEKYRFRYPQFTHFDRNIMKPSISTPSMVSSRDQTSLFGDRILGHLQNLQSRLTPVQKSFRPRDDYADVIMFIFIILSLVLLGRRKKTTSLIENKDFTKAISLFLKKIEDKKIREQFETFFKDMRDEESKTQILNKLQITLNRQQEFSKTLLVYIQNPTDHVLYGIASFLTLLSKKSKDNFIRMLEDVTGQKNLFRKIKPYYESMKELNRALERPPLRRQSEVLSVSVSQQQTTPRKVQQQVKQQQQKQQNIFDKNNLPKFFQQNKQLLVSPEGSVSPVFRPMLDRFLDQHQTDDPELLKQFIYTKARQFIRKNPTMTLATMNNLLKNSITQAGLEQYKKQKISVSNASIITSISPIRKSRAIHKPSEPPKQVVPKKQTKVVEKQLTQRVKRVKKEQQTQTATSIMDFNIQNIMNSKKYKKTIETLIEFLQNHPEIETIYIVDAPNILYSASTSYRKRQQTTVRYEFINLLRRQFQMGKHDMIIIVSQMNLRDWMKNREENDPITFSHILDDRDNIFHIRVGCVDTTTEEPSDCFKTIGFNEMDDFVRKDLMARMADELTDRTFIEISNDTGKNWQFI